MNHIVAVVHEDGTPGERRVHLVGRNIGHRRRRGGDGQCGDECDDGERQNSQDGTHGYLTAPAAIFASSSSCCALAAPLTPTAPTICPSTVMGMPPASGVISFTATSDTRPLFTASSRFRVGMRNVAAVRALSV